MSRLEGVVRHVLPRRALVDVDGTTIEVHVRGALKGGPRRRVHVVAIGDRVRIRGGSGRGAWLDEVLPRRNVVSRIDPGDPRGERRHDLAANLDALCVVASLDLPRWNPRAVDRFLVLGEVSGVPPWIVCNKIDLGAGLPGQDPLAVLAPYREAGYRAFPVSARAGLGLDPLRAALSGRLTLLIGPSGAGKSTLLNVLFGLRLRTGEVSRSTAKGTHTTTRVEWIDLPGGGAVLDSPGIRSIRPAGLRRSTLAACFPEFRGLAVCRFPDCRHQGEAGCALPPAVESGRIDAGRYDSYLRILRSLPG